MKTWSVDLRSLNPPPCSYMLKNILFFRAVRFALSVIFVIGNPFDQIAVMPGTIKGELQATRELKIHGGTLEWAQLDVAAF